RYGPAHERDPSRVRREGRPEGPVGGVADAELVADFFHDLRQRGVMDVADAAEQVMLDLGIQPAQERGEDAVAAGRIRRGGGRGWREGEGVPARGRQLVLADAADGNIVKVIEEVPLEGEETVEQPEVDALRAVEPQPRLVRREPGEEADVDVVVVAFDVRVG